MLFLVFERFLPLVTLMWILLTFFFYWVDDLLGVKESKWHELLASLFDIAFCASVVFSVVYVGWQLSWWAVLHTF